MTLAFADVRNATALPWTGAAAPSRLLKAIVRVARWHSDHTVSKFNGRPLERGDHTFGVRLRMCVILAAWNGTFALSIIKGPIKKSRTTRINKTAKLQTVLHRRELTRVDHISISSAGTGPLNSKWHEVCAGKAKLIFVCA